MLNKDEVIKAFQDEISVLHTKFDELKVQASLGKSELSQAVQPEIRKIESQLSDAKKSYEQITSSSGDALGDLKEGLTMALSSISESVKSATGRFKGQ